MLHKNVFQCFISCLVLVFILPLVSLMGATGPSVGRAGGGGARCAATARRAAGGRARRVARASGAARDPGGRAGRAEHGGVAAGRRAESER